MAKEKKNTAEVSEMSKEEKKKKDTGNYRPGAKHCIRRKVKQGYGHLCIGFVHAINRSMREGTPCCDKWVAYWKIHPQNKRAQEEAAQSREDEVSDEAT